MSDAALGKRNKIQIDFDSQVLKNVFTTNMPYNISMTNKEDGSANDQLGILTISIGEDDEERVLLSHLLSNDRWVGYVVDLLDLENMNIMTNVTHQQKDKAHHLVKILQKKMSSILCIESKTNSNVLNGVCNLHTLTLLLMLHAWS
jgi:hypothetical protein